MTVPDTRSRSTNLDFERLEAKRRRSLTLAGSIFGGCLLVTGLTALLAPQPDTAFLPLVIGLVVAPIIMYLRMSKISRQVAAAVTAYKGYAYDRNAKSFQYRLFDSLVGLYNHTSTQDHVSGRYGNIAFEFADVHHTMETGSSKSKRRLTVFKGTMVRMLIPNPTGTVLLITSDKGFFNRFGGLFSGLERITLEDPHFEDYFEVYGTDQIQARRFLTPSMMERFVTVGARHNGLQCFVDGVTLGFTLPSRKGNFSVSWFSEINARLARQFLRDIEDVESLADALNLEKKTRI